MDLTLEEKLGALRQISERKMLKILDSISGLKDLLIEPILMKPLERFIGVTALRKHGVEKIFRLDSGNLPIVNSQRVFLLTSEPDVVQQVLLQVQAERQSCSGRSPGHHLILTTGSYGSKAVSVLVEEEGLWGHVTLHFISWELLKLDDGLWSLELSASLRSLMVQSDLSMLKSIAKSIWCLQLVLGKPRLTLSQGALASKVLGLMETLQWPQDETRQRGGEGSLGCLVIVSRDIDWPASLVTPVTYTALLDQVLGVRCGHVSLPSSDSSGSSEVQMPLNSRSDPIYQHIRNLHFSSVFPYLREQTKALQTVATNSKDLSSAAEIKQFIKQQLAQTAQTKKALTHHIAACEAVVEQVGSSFESLHTAESLALQGKRGALPLAEDLLGQGLLSFSQAVRLIALLSLCGLHDEATALKAQTLLCHGHQHLATFEAMERIGLLTEGDGTGTAGTSLVGRVAHAVNRKTSSVQVIAKRFKLFPADEASANPNPKLPAQNMGYVFGGAYTPIVCRVVEWLARGEPVAQIDEALKLLPGPTVWQGSDGSPIPKPTALPVSPKTFFVFFIGGVTHAEVAAFQILEALTGAKIVVSGTSVLSKDSIAKACRPN